MPGHGTCPECGLEVERDVSEPMLGDSFESECPECGAYMQFWLPERP